jgi:hypothetical protein
MEKVLQLMNDGKVAFTLHHFTPPKTVAELLEAVHTIAQTNQITMDAFVAVDVDLYDAIASKSESE